MADQFKKLIENIYTIDEALSLIPGFMSLNNHLNEEQKDNLRTTFQQLIHQNKFLLEQRYIDDISEHEADLLKKIGNVFDIMTQLDPSHPIDSGVGEHLVGLLTKKTTQLINRVKREAGSSPFSTPRQESNTADLATQQHQSPVPIAPAPISPLFSNVTEEFIQERTSRDNWQPKTQEAYEKTFKLFIDLTGDQAIEDIPSEAFRQFKTDLQQLPKHLTKIKKYRTFTPMNRYH